MITGKRLRASRQTGVVLEVCLRWVDVADDVRPRVRVGGDAPPVVLLHGRPRTRTTWHRFTPPPDHSQAPERAMAGDVVALTAHLGHQRFAVLAHDRGGYVAHRLAVGHPWAVRR